MKILICYCFLIFSSANFIFANNPEIRFRKITSDNGLSDNIVRVVLQDHDGFIWIGTQNGLNRYDGVDFKVYKNDSENPNTLSNNLITTAIISSDSILWVGSNHGIDYYYKNNDTFKEFDLCSIIECDNEDQKFFVSAMHSKGDKFYTTVSTQDSLYLLKREKNKFNFKVLTAVPLNNNVTYYAGGLSVDKHNSIWFGTHASGLYELKLNGNLKYYKIDDTNKKNGLTSNFIHDIAVDSNNNIWIATYGGGICKYNRKSESFTNYLCNNTESNTQDINCIYFDQNNNLWIGSDKSGIAKYDKQSDDFIFLDKDKMRTNISYYSVWSIFVDKYDGLWVGTYNGGINYWCPKNNNFNHIKPQVNTPNWLSTGMVKYFSQTNTGNVLVSTDGGGIYTFSPENMSFKETMLPNTKIEHNIIKPIHIDNINNLWARLQNDSLYKLSPDNDSFKTSKIFPCNGKVISHPEIKTIKSDSKNNVWIGTDEGLNKYNNKTGEIEYFVASDKKGSLSNDYIRNILVDDDNNLWLSTLNGINYYNVRENCFYNSENNPNGYNIFKPMGINSIFKDSKDRYWVATAWNGLFMFDKTNFNLKPITPVSGFNYSNICSIQEDDDNNLWISSKKGLYKYNHDKGRVNLYTINDGLQSNVFNSNSSIKLNDGQMLFGGINGFNIFHPENIKKNDISAPIVITSFSLFNNTITHAENNKILKKQISESDTIWLTHEHSFFTISFRMLNFSVPKEIKYAYKLEPFDKEWNYVDNRNFATYTNLDPGTYYFRVKASTNNRTWHERESVITVLIAPPFYKTIWFKVLIFIIVLLVIYFTHIIRTNNIRAINKELATKVKDRTKQLEISASLLKEKQEKILIQNEELIKHKGNLENAIIERTKELETAKIRAEESDKLKSAFLANMSHEIRTPLNAIVGFSQIIAEQEVSQKSKNDYIHIIRQNCDSLLLLVSDILDISKIESGQLKISNKQFNSAELIDDLFKNSEKAINNKNIKLICDTPLPNFTVYSDLLKIKQIINNFLSNAIKYTDKGEIHLGYTFSDNDITFYVRDTGSGIPENQIKHIFERFYKFEKDTTKQHRGTGLGLAISNELAELLGGKIEVTTEINKGSTFFLIMKNCVIA